MTDELLRVQGLSTRFFTQEGQINAVEDISFTVHDHEIYGIVGESGSGKSVTARSIIGLIDSPGRITDGEIWFREPTIAQDIQSERPEAVDGDFVDILALPEDIRESLRGPSFSMIFQDAMKSFNPSLTVGRQIAEAVEVQRQADANPRSVKSRTQGYNLGKYLSSLAIPSKGYIKKESRERAVDLLEQVGIPDPETRAQEYPHQFSGGMLQRAMVAQALAGEPDILIADEPTTALDVTIQSQILNLLNKLQDETGMSVILITHNLGVIARMCNRVGVMYAGEIVERGQLEDIYTDPIHPYTQGLLGSVPDLDDPSPRLDPIPGNVPSLIDSEMGNECYFIDRCPKAMQDCRKKPPEFESDNEHGVKCYLANRSFDESKALSKDTLTSGETKSER